MDHLREMETFVAVAQSESFTHAARQLDTSRSTVTRIVAGLEARLGTRLLVRSTHDVSLTAAGALFAREAADILSQVQRLHDMIEQEQAGMTGEIRIGAPPSFASLHLQSAISDFRAQYPGVNFEITADDGSLNIVREALNFSIRIAPILPDMAHVARLLVRVPQVLVAAPAYLDRHGTPRTVAELADHNCLLHRIKSPAGVWTFDEELSVRVRGALSSNLGEVLLGAAIAGEGVSIHPTYMIAEALRTGALIRILPDHRAEEMAIYAVYAERHFRPERERAFLDFLKGWLRARSGWFLD
ncbi:transcriptional regulator [Puniceibacterium sp. IMCC21224]|nr:transcriptional regulator [Puniceibacterium sp. IMCC21224]